MKTSAFNLPARPAFKSILLASAAFVVAAADPQVAFAQQAAQAASESADPAETSADAIVVTGYLQSLATARDIKKKSVITVDVIVAEDMAKFPELNLAESLQRLPGVQITREAGEGRRISLRGLGSDFARVQLNGMEVLGNVDSAQDSRGQRTRDRAFDFNIFASELFSRVEVEKTFQAKQHEGGMAGTVGLFTGKPFDYATGLKGALTVKGGSNQYTKDGQFRVAGLISQNWDNRFGISLSVAYGRRRTTEQGHNTYNYTQPSSGDIADMIDSGLDLSNLTAEQQAKVKSGDLYWADGNRLSSWNAKQERLGITASVQWRPADNLLLTFDGVLGKFRTEREELHLATRPLNGAGSIAIDGAAGSRWPEFFRKGSVLNDIRWDKNNYVTMSDVTGTTLGSENRRSLNKNKFNQGVLTFKWDASDAFTVDGHFGEEKSTYDTPYDDKFYMRAKGNMIADYGTDGRSATFTYPGWNPTDPSTYAMDNFYYRAFNNSSKLREGTLNLQYKMSQKFTLRVGGAYHKFTQDGASYFYDGGDNGTTGKTRGTSVAGITDVFKNTFGSWLIGNYDKGFAKYNEYHRLVANKDGTGGVLQDIENVYTTSEETFSGYAQLDWDGELLGMGFRGNVGARAYHTDTRSQGWIQGDSYAYLGTADVKGNYDGILPAMNAVLDLTPDTLLRFAATQNLNRPGMDSIAAKGSAFKNEDNGEISASRGNPNLKPYKDVTLDFSVEHYFGKVGLLSASVFHKWINNFIGSQNLSNIPFSQTGLPLSAIPGATPDTLVKDFSVPINVPGTKTLTGVELAAQSQFTFLPAPFDKLGASANFTYVDADKALTGISNVSYNATVYYETDHWGLRGSLSHRNMWYSGRSEDPMSADTRGFEGSTYIDASAFVNVTPKLQVTMNVINLTNEKDTQFWGQSRYLYNQNQSGATYLAGIAYRF